MHISSLTSILAAAINAFSSEAETSPSDKTKTFHLGYKRSLTTSSYMTFLDNTGYAQSCSSVYQGYRTFVQSGSSSSATLNVSNMDGDSTLCASAPWVVDNFTAYNVTLCEEDSYSPITFNLDNDNGNDVYATINGISGYPRIFSTSKNPPACLPLTFSLSSDFGNGDWLSITLSVD